MEECFEIAMENFRVSNKLTDEQLDELISFSEGTFNAICKQSYKLFQDRCQ